MKVRYTVSDAAYVVDIQETQLRNWLQRSVFDFGKRSVTGRIKFSERDIRCLAVMRELTNHGLSPNVAAKKAPLLVDRAGNHSLVAVVSLDPALSPMLIPNDDFNLTTGHAVITVPLAPLWAEIRKRISDLDGE